MGVVKVHTASVIQTWDLNPDLCAPLVSHIAQAANLLSFPSPLLFSTAPLLRLWS